MPPPTVNTTKIIEEVKKDHFKRIISKYKSSIHVGSHALDHLSDAQRKIFKEEDLINPIIRENPVGIGLQRNGRYAVFYKRKWGYLRIILEVKSSKIEIITFLNTDRIPNLKRIKNGR